jgi:hypothetical protein
VALWLNNPTTLVFKLGLVILAETEADGLDSGNV